MDVVHEIGYPAIAKAQQLSAERLGVRDANRWDITRERHSGDDSDVGTEHTEGRRKKCQQLTNENVAAAMRSSLPPGHRPPTATAARRGVGDADGKRRDKPVSPLPPRHDRSAQRMLLVDITQVLRGVRGEAVALDRFLALEVEPAAQQIFDEAASEHAKACRLLTGLPVAAFGIDPVSISNNSTPTTATNTNDDDDDDSSGVTAAAASATAVAGVVPNARRRVVKAQVIKTQPPPEFSLRASLPARRGAGAGRAFGRPPSVVFVGRGAGAGVGARAGGSGDNSRWSLPGRHYRTSEAAGKSGRSTLGGGGGAGVQRAAAVPRGGGPLVATREAGAGDASGASCGDGEAQEEGEEDDGEWELQLPDGQLATDISSKMAGLSSLIRRKATAGAEAGRNLERRKQ